MVVVIQAVFKQVSLRVWVWTDNLLPLEGLGEEGGQDGFEQQAPRQQSYLNPTGFNGAL